MNKSSFQSEHGLCIDSEHKLCNFIGTSRSVHTIHFPDTILGGGRSPLKESISNFHPIFSLRSTCDAINTKAFYF